MRVQQPLEILAVVPGEPWSEWRMTARGLPYQKIAISKASIAAWYFPDGRASRKKPLAETPMTRRI